MSNRDRINKSCQSIKVSIREMERVDKTTGKELNRLNKAALNGLAKSKATIEKRILELINQDDELEVNTSPSSIVFNSVRTRYQTILRT
jgi:LAS superfamily LD-carboxypeptidase LdcB